MKQYDTPRNRLALTYLGIIMVLSIGFSVIFYRESSRAVGSGFALQTTQIRNNVYFTAPGALERIRDNGINDFNNDLLMRIIILNVIMFAAGGFLSLYLAERSLKPMEDAIETQSRFTSDAAHELRTPLTAMKTEIEVALRSKKLDSKDAKEILSSNLEEIGKLETLTEALLRLAKSGHRPDASAWAPVKITDVLEAAHDRVLPQAKEHRIDFELPLPSSVKLSGDYGQLVELFVVLFDNAVKYGTDKTNVTVAAMQNDHNIVVSVTDKGIGITPEDLPHVFERFYRADQSRTKTKTTGYGLGLSVAEAITKSHSGTITVTSEPKTGTTFTVMLPR